jgi:hypothetical protein
VSLPDGNAYVSSGTRDVRLPHDKTARVRAGAPVGDDGTIVAKGLALHGAAVDAANVGLFYRPSPPHDADRTEDVVEAPRAGADVVARDGFAWLALALDRNDYGHPWVVARRAKSSGVQEVTVANRCVALTLVLDDAWIVPSSRSTAGFPAGRTDDQRDADSTFGYGDGDEEVSLAIGTELHWPDYTLAGRVLGEAKLRGAPKRERDGRSCARVAHELGSSKPWTLCWSTDPARPFPEPPEAPLKTPPDAKPPQSAALPLWFAHRLYEDAPAEAEPYAEPIEVRFDFSQRRETRLTLSEQRFVISWSAKVQRLEIVGSGPMTWSADGRGHGSVALGPLAVRTTQAFGNDEPRVFAIEQPLLTYERIPETRSDERWRYWDEMLGMLPVAPDPIAPEKAVEVAIERQVGTVNGSHLSARGTREIRLSGAATIAGRRCARLEFEDRFDDGDERFAAAIRGRGVAYYDVERHWFCAVRYTSHAGVIIRGPGDEATETRDQGFAAVTPAAE